ncbi:MAG: protein kinase [Prosthecobacter sp.]
METLKRLEEDSSSTLYLARDASGAECCIRRFKTQKPEEIEGLNELFSQLSILPGDHLLKVGDFGRDEEGFFVKMAGPPAGETLEKVLDRGPLTEEEFEALATQLLNTLDTLHEHAQVHGSLRTDYVRITGTAAKNWRITLEGFGQGFASRGDSKDAQVRAYRCTAPEQWEDGSTRRRTDVYGLGCVLYEALAARPPFDSKSLKELRHKHMVHDLPPLRKLAPHVPSWMCAWVMHLLAADPEQRPRKAGVARMLFERREEPNLPELPPLEKPAPVTTEPAPTAAPAVPEIVSAAIPLPNAQSMSRHVTSSTIPIEAGPHVTRGVRIKPGESAINRRTFAPPRKPPSAHSRNKTPMIIAATSILLMLLVFIIPHCRGSLNAPPPSIGKPSQGNQPKKPGSPPKKK